MSDKITAENRLLGPQESVHHLVGGGKFADVLLWRNKTISAGVLTGATVAWVLFEWLYDHFLTLLCFTAVLGMIVQFLWSNASGIFDSTLSQIPRVVVPEEVFMNIATAVGKEVNRGFRFLQDVACSGNQKEFLIVVVSLCGGAVIGSWCNFLTVIYIGFVAAHTLPVLYKKSTRSMISKIPKGKFKGKKPE